jgi:hypothetical protein
VFLINCPSFLPRLYGIVKLFLDPVTASKITLLGKKELLESYGAEVVPIEYGGDNPIVVPSCPHYVDAEFNLRYPSPRKNV